MPSFRQQLVEFLSERHVRQNVRTLAKYLVFVTAIIVLFSVLFHVVMTHEGREHSWITGFYWTMTTMTTVGYGDVTFESDLGRMYSIVVASSGIIFLFIVLPFIFIRYFYAPWLEAQIRLSTPRSVPADTHGHVIICRYDSIAPDIMRRLRVEGIPHFVIEPDADKLADYFQQGVPVIAGDIDDVATYRALQVPQARMVFANRSDTENTIIALTVRQITGDVPVVAVAHEDHAVEVLSRSGASRVLPLNRWLGEHLANRINAKQAESHVIGQYRDLLIAELPVHRTPLVGQKIRDTQLRENTGLSVIGVWERGRLQPAHADMTLSDKSVPVVIGTRKQLAELDYLLMIYDVNPNPVIVIGAGSVGTAAARALARKEVPVVMIERDPLVLFQLEDDGARLVTGDASKPEILSDAGIENAPSVIVTTRDDAANIFLASQCRRLNPDVRIVSRISHDRNMEAIHTAGADFVLGSASLSIEAALSIIRGKELTLLGQQVEIYSLDLPAQLRGKTLAESAIGARTGLTVIAIERNGDVTTSPTASTTLEKGSILIVLGDTDQRREFVRVYEDG